MSGHEGAEPGSTAAGSAASSRVGLLAVCRAFSWQPYDLSFDHGLCQLQWMLRHLASS